LLGDIIGLAVGIIVAAFLPELAPAYFQALSVSTLAVSGFVGGFVGAYVSTGSLSAALTAGLVAGLTAAAFAEVGSYAQELTQTGSEWAKPFGVLAHSAVGCGSAVLSGGNCGRGALAAGISEAADQSGLFGPPPKSIASWGAFKGAAEAGFIGGIAARLTGGKFDDGFTVSAAGYLFNAAAHPQGSFHCGQDQCRWALATADNSDGQPGAQIRVDPDGYFDGGAWVQTVAVSTSQYQGQFVDTYEGAVNTLYPGYGSTSGLFLDSPALDRGNFGSWIAQTSYVVPNSAGGYTAEYTFTWGFRYSPSGVVPIEPTVVSPNSFQSDAIKRAYYQ
jgi:hypothetical protein